MDIFLLGLVLAFIAARFGSKPISKRVRGRRLSDEVHPAATLFMGIL